MECLKAAFTTDNRAQIRSATYAVLMFIIQEQHRPTTVVRKWKPTDPLPYEDWATSMFTTCTAWTPVQDRFILLVTITDTLVAQPMQDHDLRGHVNVTRLIDTVLRSDLNLIGLQTMDVLHQFISQLLRVLQMVSSKSTNA